MSLHARKKMRNKTTIEYNCTTSTKSDLLIVSKTMYKKSVSVHCFQFHICPKANLRSIAAMSRCGVTKCLSSTEGSLYKVQCYH